METNNSTESTEFKNNNKNEEVKENLDIDRENKIM
jgi:hypothetical protein